MDFLVSDLLWMSGMWTDRGRDFFSICKVLLMIPKQGIFEFKLEPEFNKNNILGPKCTPECWLWRNPAPGTLRCPAAPAPLVHFCDFSRCYLSNFLPLLTSSQLRVDSSKSLHLGTSPCPWVTPPPRPGPDSQTVTLLQCVEIADARTTLGSHARPGRLTQPGSCCPGIVPPPLHLSTSYFTLSATPSSNLSS